MEQPKVYQSGEEAFDAEHAAVSAASLLSEDLSNVNTAMPMLKPCLEDFVCVKAEVSANPDNGKESLRLTLNATKELPDVDGNLLPTSFPHFATVSMTATEKYNTAAIRKALAKVAQCFGVKNLGENGVNLQGKVGKVKVTVQSERTDKDGNVWPPKNQFNFVPMAN